MNCTPGVPVEISPITVTAAPVADPRPVAMASAAERSMVKSSS